VDNAQEALDTALIAYRVAEDRRYSCPGAISCDGAFPDPLPRRLVKNSIAKKK